MACQNFPPLQQKFDNILLPATLKAKQLFNYQGVAFFVVTYSLQ